MFSHQNNAQSYLLCVENVPITSGKGDMATLGLNFTVIAGEYHSIIGIV